MTGVLIRTWEGRDPRFSHPQRRAFEELVQADPDARILGLDHAHRPVVQAALGEPNALRVYAIQRNGDPTEPRHGEPDPYAGPGGRPGPMLLEPWGGEAVVPEPVPLALYFTPDAIREHFEGDDSPEALWVAKASDGELDEVGQWCIDADTLYREFHRLLVEGAIEIGGLA